MRYESPVSEKERKVGNKKKEDDAKGKDIFNEKAVEKEIRGNTLFCKKFIFRVWGFCTYHSGT